MDLVSFIEQYAKQFEVTDLTRQKLDFWLGYSIFNSARAQQEPQTLETARATLPRFRCATDGPQPSAAAAAAGYLGRVIGGSGGTVPGFGGGPDYGNTANAVLSMVAAGHGDIVLEPSQYELLP